MAVEKQAVPLSQEIAEQATILRCEVGSTVHGIGVEGTDDRDELGVCVEPPEYVIGLRHFEQYVHRSKPQGVRSEAGDLDLTIYGLRKFASLALKGNPSILLLFNVPDDKCMILTDLGRELRELAWAFASKKAGAAFLGYMQQQRQRLMGERGQMNVKRPELTERFGFDTKYAGHIIRLGFQGIDYMQTGGFPIPMPDEQRDLILAVRTGQVAENDVLTKAGEIEAELKDAIDSTTLPDLPDYDAVNAFLIDAYQRTWVRRNSLPAVLNLIEAAERMVNPDYDGWKAIEAHEALAEAVAVFVSGQEEPTDGAASDPRPDPRTHPEYWTE